MGDKYAFSHSSGGRFHDIVRDMAFDAGRKLEYKAEKEVRAYEQLSKYPFRPDVVLTLKNPRKTKRRHYQVFIEVQDRVTSEWIDKMQKQYYNRAWKVIQLRKLKTNQTGDWVKDCERLYKEIEELVDMFTSKYDGPYKHTRHKKTCEYCGYKGTNLRRHLFTCKEKKRLEELENEQ
jgi:hypothetical protein